MIAREPVDASANERRIRPAAEPFVAIRLRPQVMLDTLAPAEIDIAGHTIASRLRADDGFDLGGDGSFVVMLARADRDAALVVARRIAGEITRCSAAVNYRKWIAEVVDPPPAAGAVAPTAA